MEQKTIGKFLSALRKANGYTQQQVADFLRVSNKTVSKWECDDGYPEITMLPAIAELYNVTVDEILKGERIDKNADENPSPKIEERTKLIIDRANLSFKTFKIISFFLGIGAVLLPLIYTIIEHRSGFLNSPAIYFLAIVCSIFLIIISLIIGVVGGSKYESALVFSTYDENISRMAKKKLNKFYVADLFLCLSTVTSCFSRWIGLFWTLVFIYISLIISLVVDYLFNKKLRDKPSDKVLLLQKKVKKVTAIIAITIILFGIIIALICALFESSLYSFWYIYFDAYMLQTIIPTVCILPTIGYVVYCLLKRKIEK